MCDLEKVVSAIWDSDSSSKKRNNYILSTSYNGSFWELKKNADAFKKIQIALQGSCLLKYVYIHYCVFILRAICRKCFPSSAKCIHMKKVRVKNNFTKALQTAVLLSLNKRQFLKMVAMPSMSGYLHIMWFLPIPASWPEKANIWSEDTESANIWDKDTEAKCSWELTLWPGGLKPSAILPSYDFTCSSDVFDH